MEHLRIHYFSGTGNTARAVRIITERFREAGRTVVVTQISKTTQAELDLNDFQIIAFPILSWAAPALVLKYLKHFPKTNQTKVALLAINGASLYKGKIVDGNSGQALEQVERMLKRKGYRVILSGNASFPDNWTQMTNPCDAQTIQTILPKGDARVLDFADKVLKEQHEHYRCDPFNRAWTWLLAGAFRFIGRRVLGTFYIADERCTGCELCAKTCPAETIVMHKRNPVWKTRCEDCNRCINVCPEQAIQVSMPLMIAQLSINLVLTVWLINRALYAGTLLIPEGGWLLSLTNTTLVIVAMILAAWITLVPLRHLANWIQLVPAVRRFARRSITKSFRRYTAPGFRPGSHLQ